MSSVWAEDIGAEQPAIPLQEASLDIWDKKYRLKTKTGEVLDHSVDHTWQRVARALAEVEPDPERREHWYERFLWALRRGAIPAGRITSNAGAWEHKPATSTINCTVSGTIRDSMDGILEKVHEAGLTLKAGCGIGYEFSTLRPRGAYVSGAGAYTSGPLSFMDIYDRMCFTVSSAGGRRGAQMATFDVGHPDAMEFIRAKREDGRLRQFNCSLLITDEFMRAVEDDADWPMVFPVSEAEAAEVDLDDPEQVIWREWPVREGYVSRDDGLVACRVYNTVPARRLWNMIMSSTYDYAEPGFVLVDRINEQNNNWWCETIRATNPCVTADTWVHTVDGPRQVGELVGQASRLLVDGQAHDTTDAGFFRTATRDVVRLSTSEGYALRLTPDHRVRKVVKHTRHTLETDWVEAAALQPGDRVLMNDHRGHAEWPGRYDAEQGYLLGLLVGDGVLKEDKAVLSAWKPAAVANGEPRGIDSVMEAAREAARCFETRSDFSGWQEVPGRGEYRMSIGGLKSLALEVGMTPGDKRITPRLEAASSDCCRGFLRGFFDADGSVQGDQRKGVSVRLSQSDLPRLQAVQRMLLRLGIASTIYRDRRGAGFSRLPDGRGGQRDYPTQAQHELVVAGENLVQFRDRVGFGDREKQARLATLLKAYKRRVNRERFVATVACVEPDGREDVFDVQVPGINAFDANGLHAHNCGEQPLPPYGACLLGSINLTRYVDKPFTDQARFDWEAYRETVRVFTRMLDNVVEISGLPLDRQRREIEAKRRHGMGFLGLGSTLTLMGIKYGSEESLAFTERVAREMAVAGWETGLELSREKGPAPIMQETFAVTAEMLRKRPEMAQDGWQEGDRIPGSVLHARYSRYMQRVGEVAPELVATLAEEGARFTHHSSIAPTGTISLSLANNASNGIEPSFAHQYSRNVIREGRKTKEKVPVLSYELLAYRELVNEKATPYSEDPAETLPDYFITTDDITPKEHVAIQAAAQKWIDSSISKTANVPTEYPFQDFKDIYRYAHEQGLKGCTTFRFNPEAFQGVLVKDKDLEDTTYRFTLADGSVVEARGHEEIEYDGETHTAANLYEALKEGYYGKF